MEVLCPGQLQKAGDIWEKLTAAWAGTTGYPQGPSYKAHYGLKWEMTAR